MSIKRNFTDEDVIRYVYGEMAKKEAAAFELALIGSPELMEAFEALSRMHEELEMAVIAPGDACIDKILAFSKNFEQTAAEAEKH